MPKPNAPTVETDAEPEENHRTATRTLEGEMPWDDFQEAYKHLKRRVGSNAATRVRLHVVPGDGNGTPDRYRVAGSY